MSLLKHYRFADLTLGQQAEFSVSLSPSIVDAFSQITGDINPLLVDEEYAKKTQFHGRIVNGQLGASLFSQLIGVHLPGEFALCLSQTVKFVSPLRLNMNIRVCGEIIFLDATRKTILLSTSIVEDNKLRTLLIIGEAKVLLRA